MTKGAPDLNRKPCHNMARLTTRQLASKELTAQAMYLQGFGENVIAETLQLSLADVIEYTSKELTDDD